MRQKQQYLVVIHPKSGKNGTTLVKWEEDKQVQQYFHEAPLKYYGLTALRRTHRLLNREGKEVPLTYCPAATDALVLVEKRKKR